MITHVLIGIIGILILIYSIIGNKTDFMMGIFRSISRFIISDDESNIRVDVFFLGLIICFWDIFIFILFK